MQERMGIPNHDLFRTFMILAIGSIPLYRTGTHRSHPYGYFRTALKHLDGTVLSRGLKSIQDLLLIVRFGIYYHIGTEDHLSKKLGANMHPRYIDLGNNNVMYANMY